VNAIDWWTNQGLPHLLDAMRRALPFDWAHYDFMLKALIECVLLTPICAAMGVKIVNYRMAFFSDAIAHSAFTGVALGFLLNEMLAGWGGFDPRIALICFGLLIALGIAFVRRRTELSNDTVIGVFFSTVVALGIALITTNPARTTRFAGYLYGDILTLDAVDLALTALLALLVIGFMAVSFNSLTLVGLNAELAQSRGIRVRLYDYVFSLLLALVVTVSIRTAGILLVSALLIVPAAAARNLARDIGGMFCWAMALGLLSGLIGTLASFSPHLGNISTGSLIVLVAAAFFGLSFLVRR
jgi:zinc transport system permease protein